MWEVSDPADAAAKAAALAAPGKAAHALARPLLMLHLLVLTPQIILKLLLLLQLRRRPKEARAPASTLPRCVTIAMLLLHRGAPGSLLLAARL